MDETVELLNIAIIKQTTVEMNNVLFSILLFSYSLLGLEIELEKMASQCAGLVA